MRLENFSEQEDPVTRSVLETKVPHDSITPNNEADKDHIKFRMALQTAVAIEKAGNQNDALQEWVTTHSDQYRRIYDQLINENPLIFASFETVRDVVRNEEVMRKMRGGLYGNN